MSVRSISSREKVYSRHRRKWIFRRWEGDAESFFRRNAIFTSCSVYPLLTHQLLIFRGVAKDDEDYTILGFKRIDDLMTLGGRMEHFCLDYAGIRLQIRNESVDFSNT